MAEPGLVKGGQALAFRPESRINYYDSMAQAMAVALARTAATRSPGRAVEMFSSSTAVAVPAMSEDNGSVLRNQNLVPLSHQHQHALALCVRIGKAFAEVHDTPDVHRWEAEIVQLYDSEIAFHFLAEEKVLFPAAEQWDELQQLVDELRIEHTLLRRNVERARARQFTVTDLQVFTATLSEHVRKEERQLFEGLQRLLSGERLSQLGAEIDKYFQSSGMPGVSCAIHSDSDTTQQT
jgi:hemerythrin-like domain-containing protein